MKKLRLGKIENFWLIILAILTVHPLQAQTSNSGSSGSTVFLLGRLDTPQGTADVWGYVDPNTSKEYALVGYGLFTQPPNAGVVIVDVTEPETPRLVANVNSVPGFDVKTWQHYMYSVDGRNFGDGGIVDIADPENPQKVGTMRTSHNIFIDERGFMYLECPGLSIYDLNPNPAAPQLIWSDGTSNCHDAAVIGNRLYDFHGFGGTNIYDVADPTSPQLLGAINDPAIRFHHSGWTTEDGNFLFICDELATHPTADFTVWDISDPGNPQKVAENLDRNATIHNLYVRGNYAFTSYYSAGFRVFDITDPTNPFLLDEFDTSPQSGEIIGGTFGAYPFAPSGNIYVSDEVRGLHVFSFTSPTTDISSGPTGVPTEFALLDNFPNPFNPETVIFYRLPRQAQVKLVIYNQIGNMVRTLVTATRPSGTHRVTWDGRDQNGMALASGIYFYRMQAGEFQQTKRMLLLR